MEPLLKVKNLNKSYKKSDFNLSNISLSIQPHEVVGLVGKNGSGKSTLINTLVGNRFKDSGDIQFFGKTVSQKNYDYKENIGVVFDDLRVPNKLNIKEINRVFSKIYTSWNSNKFFSIMNQFELPIHNAIESFSRGMRMKAALAIALGHESKLLILDEATAGMDVASREEVVEMLEDYIAEGNGVLFSSHISEDIEQLATKLIFMRDGKIILKEDKQYLLDNYGIVEQPTHESNIPEDIIVASRIRKDTRITLINNLAEQDEARPLQNIDDATKLLMRGDQ